MIRLICIFSAENESPGWSLPIRLLPANMGKGVVRSVPDDYSFPPELDDLTSEASITIFPRRQN